jgi:hypothetical protein
MGNYRLPVSIDEMAAAAGLLRGPAGEHPVRYLFTQRRHRLEIGRDSADITAIVGGHCH